MVEPQKDHQAKKGPTAYFQIVSPSVEEYLPFLKVIGFEPLDAVDKLYRVDGKIQHIHMKYVHDEQVQLMMTPEGAFGGAQKCPKNASVDCPMVPYIYTPDVDSLYKTLSSGNMTCELSEPKDQFWGDRHMRVKDNICGYHWDFGTKTVNKGEKRDRDEEKTSVAGEATSEPEQKKAKVE